MSPIPKPIVRMTTGPAAPVPTLAQAAIPENSAGASVVLALGSNLGDRAVTIRDAVRSIADLDGVELTAVSGLYETAAMKADGVDPKAPRYLNAVVTVRYIGDPHALLVAINAVENDHGRVRTERWGDRTLDIDIIVFGDRELSDDGLTIPHPRAWARDFVLAPWLQIDPDAVIPGHGRVKDLLAAIENTVQPYGAQPGDLRDDLHDDWHGNWHGNRVGDGGER